MNLDFFFLKKKLLINLLFINYITSSSTEKLITGQSIILTELEDQVKIIKQNDTDNQLYIIY
jgi:hypothetical protein